VEWPGGIDWVLKSDLVEFDPTYATPRGKDAYFENVKAFPAGGELTANQKALVERAMQFADDGSIPTPKEMDELNKIDVELLARLKTYYRFLVQEHLITDDTFSMSAARDPWKAHELSTKWMLNWKNNFLGDFEKRIEFAERLVEIDGKDKVLDIEWANQEQVKKLSSALMPIQDQQARQELAMLLIPRESWATSAPPSIDWSDPKVKAIVDKYHLTDDRKRLIQDQWKLWSNDKELLLREFGTIHFDMSTIDPVVAEIRDYFSSKQHEPQEAPALEGYDENDSRRYPNVMGVAKSKHLTGEAADIFFPYRFYYFDPIIDAIAKVFGLRRAALAGSHGEYWHYQAVGQPLNGTQSTEKRGG
jgi:hypothetical protein